MLKSMGFLLVVLCGMLLAFKNQQGYGKRMDELEAFVEAIRLMRAEMIYLKTPVGEVFRLAAQGENPVVNQFFEYLHKSLGAGKTLKQLWNSGLQKYTRYFCLNQKDILVLSEFSVLLGQTDIENQIENLDNTLDKLSVQLNSARQEREKNQKPQGMLYITGALVMAILAL